MTGIFADEVSEYTTITISKDTAKKLKEFFLGQETYNPPKVSYQHSADAVV